MVSDAVGDMAKSGRNTHPGSLAALKSVALISVAVAGFAMLSGAAMATPPTTNGFGHLTASANGPMIVRGTAVDLQIPDRTLSDQPEMYDAAQAVLEKFVATRGLRVDPAGPLVLRLRIDTTAYDGVRAPLPTVQPRGASNTRPEVEVVNNVHIPFKAPPGPGAATYVVHLDLFRPGQPPLWTASVEASAQTTTPDRLIARMTEALTGVFGLSADRDFTLQCGTTDLPGALCL